MMSEQLELLTENPSQWMNISYITPEIQKYEIKPFILLALKELEGIPDSRMSSLVNVDKFAAVRAVVRHLSRLRSAIKVPWEQNDVQTFLEGLKFSTECITELSTLLCSEQMYENIPKHLRMKPGLASLQWKIDVSLSQTNISLENPNEQRKKEILYRDTYVIMILELTDGQRKSFRLSIPKFHELRYVIANALKTMIVLERRKCMRKE